MHAYLRSLALGLALLLPAVPAFAADAPAKTDAAIPDKPTRITERNTPVAVEYEGNDSIGSRLATRVKGRRTIILSPFLRVYSFFL